MKLGFIGLGSMGLPMAENLIAAGHELTVWNRSPDKAESLVRKGARLAQRPADVAGPDGVIITMLADDPALESVLNGPDGIAGKLGRGGLHISMSTISAGLSARLAQLHGERGAAYIAAPVFGRPDAAAAKMLFVLCAGDEAACQRARPALEAVGQKVFQLGAEPVHANIVKLGGNFMIMAAIEALAESMTLGEKYGVPRQQMVDVLTQSIFPAPLFINYGKQIASHAYQPARFKFSLGLKDAGLVMAAADGVRLPMPLATLMQQRFQAGLAQGRGDLDWTAVALNVAEEGGTLPAGWKPAA